MSRRVDDRRGHLVLDRRRGSATLGWPSHDATRRWSLADNPMTRRLRTRLPNGTIVLVEVPASNAEGMAADAERLAALLSGRGDGRQLLACIANLAPTIFPEADPAHPASLSPQSGDMGIDLTFRIHDTERLAAVQIKGPGAYGGQYLTQAIEDLRLLLERQKGSVRFGLAYLIAGRNVASTPWALNAQESIDRSKVPLHILTWDDVEERVVAPSTGHAKNELTVVLVEVIDLSRRLLRAIASNPNVLLGIDDRKFEEIVATLLHDLGAQDVELTPPRKDGGRDVMLTHCDRSGQRCLYLIECKHWVSGNKVTLRWALSLLNVVRRDQATAGVLLSTSGFGPRLIEQEAMLTRKGVHLRDRSALLGWVRGWQRLYGRLMTEPIEPSVILGLDLRP